MLDTHTGAAVRLMPQAPVRPILTRGHSFSNSYLAPCTSDRQTECRVASEHPVTRENTARYSLKVTKPRSTRFRLFTGFLSTLSELRIPSEIVPFAVVVLNVVSDFPYDTNTFTRPGQSGIRSRPQRVTLNSIVLQSD